MAVVSFDDLPSPGPPAAPPGAPPAASPQAVPAAPAASQQDDALPPFPIDQDRGTSYTATPEQNRAAWDYWRSGNMTASAPKGSINFPYMWAPNSQPPVGAYIIDVGGNVRKALPNEDGRSIVSFDDQPSAGQDVMRAIANAPEHWAPDALGTFGNVRQAVTDLPDNLVNLAFHAIGAEPADQNTHFARDAFDRQGMGMIGDPLGTALYFGPSTATLDTGQQRTYGPYYQPQTLPGKIAGTAVRMAPTALLGEGSFAPRVLGVLGAAGGSEGAGAAADQYAPQLSPVARVAGAILGGGLTSALAAPDKAAAALATASKGVKPEDLQAAQDLRLAAEQSGVPLTYPEAVNAVSGNAYPQLQRLQQRVEGTAAGGPVIQPMMAARPDQARTALDQVLGLISPKSESPSMLGPQAQSAAQGAIDNLTNERSALVAPYYSAAANATVNPDDMTSLLGSIDAKIAADKTGILAGPLGKFRSLITQAVAAAPAQGVRGDLERAWTDITGEPAPGAGAPPAGSGETVPILDLENLDRARKFARDDTAARMASGSFTPEQAAAVGGYADRLDQIMEKASPDYVGGKANFQQFTNDNIAPVQAGPVGRIAGTVNPTAQASALYPANPLPGAASETTAAAQALNAQQPGVVDALTRQHLEQSANAAMAAGRGGPNAYGPATFAARVAGNPEQASVLNAGVAASAGPEQAQQVSRLLNVMAATGRRLPVTPSDASYAAALKDPHELNPMEAGVGLGVAQEAAGPIGVAGLVGAKALAAVANAIGRARATANARGMAQLITGPAADTAKTVTQAQAAKVAQALMLARAGAAGTVIGAPNGAPSPAPVPVYQGAR